MEHKEEAKGVDIDELLENASSFKESDSSNGSPIGEDFVGLSLEQQVGWSGVKFLEPPFNNKAALNPIIEEPSKEDGSYDSNNSCIKVNPFKEETKTALNIDQSTTCPPSPSLNKIQGTNNVSVTVPNEVQDLKTQPNLSVNKSQTLQLESKTESIRRMKTGAKDKSINLKTPSQASTSTKRTRIKDIEEFEKRVFIESSPSCTCFNNTNNACVII